MTEQPDYGPDEVLTPQQLAQVRSNFAKLSLASLRQAYSEALERCRLDRRGRAPRSAHIQVLVQAWKLLETAK